MLGDTTLELGEHWELLLAFYLVSIPQKKSCEMWIKWYLNYLPDNIKWKLNKSFKRKLTILMPHIYKL